MKKLCSLILTTCFCWLLSITAVWSQSTSNQFKIKGVHLDLRIQVMKMPALKAFAKRLKNQGMNTLIMEWEGTYPFVNEPLLANRYAYTPAEIKEFLTYCKQLNIDVIPLQQSFGHVEYILKNNKYAALREDSKDLSQVCPSEAELNRKLFTSLYTELATTFSSPYLHIGGDETHLLGHCEKCSRRAAQVGISQLYFDHIKLLCNIAVKLGKRPVLWADIALKYPQYIRLLPKQTVFIDWNYGWDLNRFGNHEQLFKSGYEIWGAPAMRSDPDNYFLTGWEKHFKNIRDFTQQSRTLGYNGIVLTSWSTSGVYSSVYESENDVIDLYAVRHAYPISGFNLLVNAFTKAATSNQTLDISRFIADYTANHYGFSKTQAQQFEKALLPTQYKVVNDSVSAQVKISLQQLLDSAKFSAQTFHNLKPTKGVNEFAQYSLMADIRVNYLTFKLISAKVNSPFFTRKQALVYLKELKQLIAREKLIDQMFTQLNGYLLYPSEIAAENALRSQQALLLYNKLKNSR